MCQWIFPVGGNRSFEYSRHKATTLFLIVVSPKREYPLTHNVRHLAK